MKALELARVLSGGVLDAMFPPLCRKCGAWMARGERERICVCRTCWDGIERAEASSCLRCGLIATPERAHHFLAANWTERIRLAPFDFRGRPAEALAESRELGEEETPTATFVGAVCRRCRDEAPAFLICRAPGRYEGLLADLIHQLKYRPRASLARPLGEMLRAYATQRSAWFEGDPLIVPVPVHPVRRRERGFNQAELLARELAQASPTRLEVLPFALIRTRPTKTQTDLPLEERFANVFQAFAPGTEAAHVAGRAVILVDDVVTTTATSSACASALTSIGAAEVRVLALARGVLGSKKL